MKRYHIYATSDDDVYEKECMGGNWIKYDDIRTLINKRIKVLDDAIEKMRGYQHEFKNSCQRKSELESLLNELEEVK